MMALSGSEKIAATSSAVLAQYKSVWDGQTDRIAAAIPHWSYRRELRCSTTRQKYRSRAALHQYRYTYTHTVRHRQRESLSILTISIL